MDLPQPARPGRDEGAPRVRAPARARLALDQAPQADEDTGGAAASTGVRRLSRGARCPPARARRGARAQPVQRARLEELPATAELALGDLPPLTKHELVADQRAHPPFGTNLTYPLERYTQLHQTSGTTGPPLRVLDTAEDWAWWRERSPTRFRVAGVGAGDRVALAFSFGPHVQFWAAKEGCAGGRRDGDRAGRDDAPCSGCRRSPRPSATASGARRPTRCASLEVAVEQRPRARARRRCGSVICTGEPGASLPGGARAASRTASSADCVDHAGLTEVGPFGYPCPEGGGLHVDEDEFVCEILDAELRAGGGRRARRAA